MSDDWMPGDLALCVKRGQWITSGTAKRMRGPSKGSILTVRRVGFYSPLAIVTLWFEAWPGERYMDGFCATRFRKIHPLSIEERNAEIRLLTGKPVKEPV